MNLGENVSVVVQGPVHGHPSDPSEKQITRNSLVGLRKIYPKAEIILSTWAPSETSGLDFDELVISDDPGAIPFNDTDLKSRLNNTNRQLVSTFNGLAKATRRYAIKLRTDCMLLRPVDFNILGDGIKHNKLHILEKKIITLNIYTRHPLRCPVLFHISDLFHAGLRTDLLTFWNLPLVKEPDHTRTIDPRNRPPVNAYPWNDWLMRCAAEQYLGEQLARRKQATLHLRHYSEGSVTKLFLWLHVLANNFHLLTPDEAGVMVPPHLATHVGGNDLFQPSDRPWLDLWKQNSVSPLVRLRTALQFIRVQIAHRRPSKITDLFKHFV